MTELGQNNLQRMGFLFFTLWHQKKIGDLQLQLTTYTVTKRLKVKANQNNAEK